MKLIDVKTQAAPPPYVSTMYGDQPTSECIIAKCFGGMMKDLGSETISLDDGYTNEDAIAALYESARACGPQLERASLTIYRAGHPTMILLFTTGE